MLCERNETMKTIKQVSELSGVSIRTLQFYDEIGLLKPAQVSENGYRQYDDASLAKLQQILFFKELDFTLKEIKAILEDPNFDQQQVFRKQKELIELKRDRLNRLLQLLEKLEAEENTIGLEEFNLESYYQMLENFKNSHVNQIVSRIGNIHEYDVMLQELKAKEMDIVKIAIQQYGTLENYMKASEKNLDTFLSKENTTNVSDAIEKTDLLTKRVTLDLCADVSSPQIQEALKELIDFCNQSNAGLDMGAGYWEVMAEQYLTNPVFMQATDKKYGAGASQFIGRALQVYLESQS